MEIREKRSGVTYIQTVNAVMLVVVAQTTWGSVSGCKSSSESALAEEGTLSPWCTKRILRVLCQTGTILPVKST